MRVPLEQAGVRDHRGHTFVGATTNKRSDRRDEPPQEIFRLAVRHVLDEAPDRSELVHSERGLCFWARRHPFVEQAKRDQASEEGFVFRGMLIALARSTKEGDVNGSRRL